MEIMLTISWACRQDEIDDAYKRLSTMPGTLKKNPSVNESLYPIVILLNSVKLLIGSRRCISCLDHRGNKSFGNIYHKHFRSVILGKILA